jgi:hypothetical protein
LRGFAGLEIAARDGPAPMATAQLCNAAKSKLTEAYKATQSPNFPFAGECLQAR